MSWPDRAARARALAERYPASREILLFYAELAGWQQKVARQATSIESLASFFPSLLDLLERCAPGPLAEAGRAQTADRIGAVLRDARQPPAIEPPDDFFARALLQPWAVEHETGRCPWCASPPLAGALLPAGEGLALELVCALCFGRRPFPRGRCPGCGAQGEELATYSAPELEHLALSACERCKRYVTTVDLSREPRAIPEVDEMAGLPLDVWAREHGYTKLRPNIAGV